MRVLMVVGVALALSACESKPDSSMKTGESETPVEAADTRGLGEIDAVEGTVELDRAGSIADANKGDAVQPGDTVLTGVDSRARIALSEGSILAVGPSSRVAVAGYGVKGSKRSGSLNVIAGQFWLRVVELAGVDTDVNVETPTAVAGIRGTTIWGDTQRDLLCALAGSIEVSTKSNSGTTTLSPGECLSKMQTETPETLKPDAETVGKFLGEVHIGEPLEAK